MKDDQKIDQENHDSDQLTFIVKDSAALQSLPSESSEKQHSQEDENCNQPSELERKRSKLFLLISAGNATGQTFLFNFFSAFAVLVGVSESLLGFITSIRNLMSSLFQGTIGRLSDKMGRRYLLLIGFFMVFSSLAVLIFVNSITMLIIISVVQAFSLSIIIPVWNAALGDVTVIDERASYMGKLSAIGTAISVSLMLVLAIFFYLADEVYYGWVIWGFTLIVPERTQYLIAFAFAAINFILCIIGVFLLQETRIIKDSNKPQPKMFLALKDRTFRKYFIINSIFGLIMATMWPIFPVAQVNILDMGFTEIAVINAVFSTCSSLGQYFGGKLSDKIGRKPIIIYSRVAMFVIPVVMIWAIVADNWLLLLISNIIGGSAVGANVVGHNAYLLDISPKDQMGAYSGLNQMGWGVATFIGSLSAGFIADAIEAVVGTNQMVIITFSVITGLRLLSSIGYFFIKESFDKESRDALNERRKNGQKYVYSCEEDSATQTK